MASTAHGDEWLVKNYQQVDVTGLVMLLGQRCYDINCGLCRQYQQDGPSALVRRLLQKSDVTTNTRWTCGPLAIVIQTAAELCRRDMPRTRLALICNRVIRNVDNRLAGGENIRGYDLLLLPNVLKYTTRSTETVVMRMRRLLYAWNTRDRLPSDLWWGGAGYSRALAGTAIADDRSAWLQVPV